MRRLLIFLLLGLANVCRSATLHLWSTITAPTTQSADSSESRHILTQSEFVDQQRYDRFVAQTQREFYDQQQLQSLQEERAQLERKIEAVLEQREKLFWNDVIVDGNIDRNLNLNIPANPQTAEREENNPNTFRRMFVSQADHETWLRLQCEWYCEKFNHGDHQFYENLSYVDLLLMVHNLDANHGIKWGPDVLKWQVRMTDLDEQIEALQQRPTRRQSGIGCRIS